MRFAVAELQSYLLKLFGVESRILDEEVPAGQIEGETFYFGTTDGDKTAPALPPELGPHLPDPIFGDQAYLLRKIAGKPERFLIFGGSPRAVLWAVYELVELWGVRYLLHEDILPLEPGAFGLPDIDQVFEPELTIRQWRVINDFACGPESWGMEHYRPVLDQLAKLKFNRIFLALYPWQPFLDYEIDGLRREEAMLWFGYRYPITDDMIGRELFGNEPEFWNPDLPYGASYGEFSQAGQRHAHALMAHAHARGMDCSIGVSVTEYPPEFAPLLKDWQKIKQLAEFNIVASADTDIDDPAVGRLSGAIIKAVVNTYPEVDYLVLGSPEFRQWCGQYEHAWQSLDKRYDLESVRSLEESLSAAEHRVGHAGNPERALNEVKGDIVALYFYDRLLNVEKVLSDTARPDVPIILNSVAEELFPIFARILGPGGEAQNFVDYTASRILRRPQVLGQMPARQIPSVLIYTLHDDNVGLLPQLVTTSLHKLNAELRARGWAGFSTRYWLTADHDSCIGYLAKAAWDEEATPEAVLSDQVEAVCGKACVDDLVAMLQTVEAVTLDLEEHGLSFGFPIPGMMMKHWTAEALSDELSNCQTGYRTALRAGQRALENTTEQGKGYIGYWIGRLQFGITYFDAVTSLRQAAAAEAAGKQDECLRLTEQALHDAREALVAYASVARDQSDRGAIAILNEYVYRPLKEKVASLQS